MKLYEQSNSKNKQEKLKSTPIIFDENLFSLLLYGFMLY